MTLDYTGPIAKADTTLSGYSEVSGDPSDDGTSVIFDLRDTWIDPVVDTSGYYWNVKLGLDNCDTGYTWSDNFFQLSYVDDEQNIIDLSEFENPSTWDKDSGELTNVMDSNVDTGICCEFDPRDDNNSNTVHNRWVRTLAACGSGTSRECAVR